MMFVLLTVWFAFNVVLVENQVPYCEKHACLPYLESPVPSARVVDVGFFLANQTGPKLLQRSPHNKDTIEVLVFYPPNHKRTVPSDQMLMISGNTPKYDFVWGFRTRDTDPDSPVIMSRVLYLIKLLKKGRVLYMKDSYLIAFYEDFPFTKKQRYVEIWIPLLHQD